MQVKTLFKSRNIVSIGRPLELLHINLFGPTRIMSMSGKCYGLLVVCEFSRWTWVLFLVHKDETFEGFYKLFKRIEDEKDCKIISIRSDHGGEFENDLFQKL